MNTVAVQEFIDRNDLQQIPLQVQCMGSAAHNYFYEPGTGNVYKIKNKQSHERYNEVNSFAPTSVTGLSLLSEVYVDPPPVIKSTVENNSYLEWRETLSSLEEGLSSLEEYIRFRDQHTFQVNPMPQPSSCPCYRVSYGSLHDFILDDYHKGKVFYQTTRKAISCSCQEQNDDITRRCKSCYHPDIVLLAENMVYDIDCSLMTTTQRSEEVLNPLIPTTAVMN